MTILIGKLVTKAKEGVNRIFSEMIFKNGDCEWRCRYGGFRYSSALWVRGSNSSARGYDPPTHTKTLNVERFTPPTPDLRDAYSYPIASTTRRRIARCDVHQAARRATSST